MGIYALGRKAEQRLKEIGLLEINANNKYIRHPAHGGSKMCTEKIIEIAKHGP